MMDVEIISLNEENIDEIVSVHLKSFPDSLLTRLGYECVQRYYRWQFNSDDDVHVYGAKLEDDIVGFCVCGYFTKATGGFVVKNLSFLIWTLLRKPWLYVSFINLKKIISIAKLTFNIIKGKLLTNRIEVPANKNLGILSIAVDPMFKRRNIGTLLLNEVDSLAERLNSNVIQLTVAPYNKSAITFYLKCGWQKVDMGHNWQGLMKKHLRVNSDS